jgi:pyridoxamine 5'-phosphate oxidase
MSGDFTQAADPFAVFEQWLDEARASEPNDPNAMAVATVDADGMPNVRVVLLNGYDRAGFVFYTNTQSAKGDEIAATGVAALVFHWKSLRRQVRVRGPAERVTDAEADAYFATRPRDSQIGAWASEQSRPLAARAVFDERIVAMRDRFEGGAVPRPPHWSGYRVRPLSFELWHDRPFRLHDRVRFRRDRPDGPFERTILYP